MSSPGETIGVLREVAFSKAKPISALEARGSYCVLPSKLEPASDCGPAAAGLVDETLGLVLGPRGKPKKQPAMTLKKLEAHMSKCLSGYALNTAVVPYEAIYKMQAKACLAIGKELEACCHLITSHALCLRQQILYRDLKSKIRHLVLQEPMVEKLDPRDLDVNHSRENTNPKTLVNTLKELPKEWYILQITAEHESIRDMRLRILTDETMYSLKPVHELHLVVLPTGEQATNPICITLPKPSIDSSYDIRIEIEKLLNTNRTDLTAVYNNKDLYWKMRKRQNNHMTGAISELEFSWLREWRVLLLADYIEQLDLVKDIHNMIDKLVADSNVKEITEKSRWLLKKIATGACYLKPFEIERAVKYVLPKQQKLCKNIVLSIISKTKVMDPLKFAKRKTLMLILDECLDHVSFESTQILKHQPVARLPSFHLIYALYKQHKSSIKDGFKIIKKSNDFGTFIVNPSLDLAKMEVRIKSFVNYWLPHWKGLCGVVPDMEFFKNALTQHNILMYNGHGSGIQFLRGEDIEKLRVVASVLLFGCGSIKLVPMGGRLPAYGISNQYLIGCSPCVLGMLWEVTDGDIDKMTAKFMSSWISSSAERSWSDVDHVSWNRGKIEFLMGTNTKKENESSMLVAVAKSKDVCQQYMTSSAIVVRGLPVKLVD